MHRTALVTGATGYIAHHVVQHLLDAGWHVRASMRDIGRAEDLRRAVATGGADDGARGARMSPVALDLTSDTGWREAMEGVDALVHTASPFPLQQPRNADDAIRPALDGTRRALAAAQAAGVPRAVVTSSIVAMMNGTPKDGRAFGPEDWSALDGPMATPYLRSKTLAEREAWRLADEAGAPALTTINPGFVIGPPLGRSWGTTVEVVSRILRAKDPAVPPLGFPTVDVRDVAAAHVRALDTDAARGRRIPTAARFLWMGQMADAIAAALPHRRIVTRRAPAWLVRGIALFDPAVKSVVPNLNRRDEVETATAREVLGLTFRDPLEAVVETARWLDREGLA